MTVGWFICIVWNKYGKLWKTLSCTCSLAMFVITIHSGSCDAMLASPTRRIDYQRGLCATALIGLPVGFCLDISVRLSPTYLLPCHLRVFYLFLAIGSSCLPLSQSSHQSVFSASSAPVHMLAFNAFRPILTTPFSIPILYNVSVCNLFIVRGVDSFATSWYFALVV